MMSFLAAIVGSLGLYYGCYVPAGRINTDNEHVSVIDKVFYRVRDGPEKSGMASQVPQNPQAYAADIELFSACLSAGLGPQLAAQAVATVSHCPSWGRTARLLALGIDANRAWADMAATTQLSELAHTASSSSRSGAALTEACQRIATQHREQAQDTAIANAERAGVLIALPMTLCYLPAFFLLGLMPVLVGMSSTFFNL